MKAWLTIICLFVIPVGANAHTCCIDVGMVLEHQGCSIRNCSHCLKCMTPEELVEYAYDWQCNTADLLGVDYTNLKRLDPLSVAQLVQVFGNGGALMVLRHGEQHKSKRVRSIESAALQKVEMMREPNNVMAPVTLDSAADFVATMIALRYASDVTGRSVCLESSSNCRCVGPMKGLAKILGRRLSYEAKWDCVNYLGANVLSDEELLSLLPTGSLPWDEKLVDAVVGQGTYQRITEEMSYAIAQVPSSCFRVAMTHTQQTNAICGLRGLPIVRLGYYGFVVVPTSDDGAQLFTHGLYAD